MDRNKRLELLKSMIAIPSVNPPGREGEMGRFLLEVLEEYGLPADTYEIGEDRFAVVTKIPGKTSKRGLIFTGHMDVVPVSAEEEIRWNTDPFVPVVEGERLYGRGAADMKGGLTAGLCALIALKEEDFTPERDIFLVATVDEEDFMGGSKRVADLPELSSATDVVVMEPTGLNCCINGRGRTYGTLTFHGATGHGSQGAGDGNAILLANRFISRMMEEELSSHPLFGESFWQPVAVDAGVEPCVVPDSCHLKIDARLHPEHPVEDIWQRVESILEELGLFERTEVSVIDRRQGFCTPLDHPFIEFIKRAAEEEEIPFLTDTFMGTTDGSVFRMEGRRTVAIMGPGDLSVVHRENEWLDLREWDMAYRWYLRMMRS